MRAKLVISDLALANGVSLCSSQMVEILDQQDPLASFRNDFHIPKKGVVSDGKSVDSCCDEDSIYLCGNSLGLQPKATQAYVIEEMTKWSTHGVEGHFTGARPWAKIDEFVTGISAKLVGAADASEVSVMNSLSLNLHLMLVSFYRPTVQRHKILIEDYAFCSDMHVVTSQLSLHGLTPDNSLVRIRPRSGEDTLRTEDIVAAIAEHGPQLAVVLFAGVQFYTGQAFDMPAIVAAGHAQGCVVGFDLAHAVGNIELKLHDWDADFACWCSYKYLNSGPGGIAGCFLHSRHANRVEPRLAGWWGQDASVRFQMLDYHQPKAGAQGYQLSNPAVLPMVCLQASLEVFERAGGISELRKKSELLTAYLEMLLLSELPAGVVRILTPSSEKDRGCQLSLMFNTSVEAVHHRLELAGVIMDMRRPNVLRAAPTPLYNSYADVRNFVLKLKQALLDCEKPELPLTATFLQ